MSGVQHIGHLGCILNRPVCIYRYLSRTFCTTFAGNHHYTICTTRTVDSRCRSIFQYVYPLYISHVQRRQSQVGRDSVDDNQRVTVIDRSQATDFNGNIVTRLTGIDNLYAGYLALHRLTDIGYRRVFDIFHPDRRHGTGQIALFHCSVTYYNYIQYFRIFLQSYFQRGFPVHRNGLRLIADKRDSQCAVG